VLQPNTGQGTVNYVYPHPALTGLQDEACSSSLRMGMGLLPYLSTACQFVFIGDRVLVLAIITTKSNSANFRRAYVREGGSRGWSGRPGTSTSLCLLFPWFPSWPRGLSAAVDSQSCGWRLATRSVDMEVFEHYRCDFITRTVLFKPTRKILRKLATLRQHRWPGDTIWLSSIIL
jgi:hypothetical protein